MTVDFLLQFKIGLTCNYWTQFIAAQSENDELPYPFGPETDHDEVFFQKLFHPDEENIEFSEILDDEIEAGILHSLPIDIFNSPKQAFEKLQKLPVSKQRATVFTLLKHVGKGSDDVWLADGMQVDNNGL